MKNIEKLFLTSWQTNGTVVFYLEAFCLWKHWLNVAKDLKSKQKLSGCWDAARDLTTLWIVDSVESRNSFPVVAKASCFSGSYVHSAVFDPTRIGYCNWTGELSTSHPVVGRLVFNLLSPKGCQNICISSSFKMKGTLDTCTTAQHFRKKKKTQKKHICYCPPICVFMHFDPCWALVHSTRLTRFWGTVLPPIAWPGARTGWR